jgi:hypothetical protein
MIDETRGLIDEAANLKTTLKSFQKKTRDDQA